MKKQELTDWYPPHIKPVRVGWYHTGLRNENPKNGGSELNQNLWWNGMEWSTYENGLRLLYQNRWWRGIKK
jgi:hypothetical protein